MPRPEAGAEPRVTVFIRRGCHLCDDVVALVERVCAVRRVAWLAVDVDTDPGLRARYTDHVPVTCVDGREIARWFLAEEGLAAALERH